MVFATYQRMRAKGKSWTGTSISLGCSLGYTDGKVLGSDEGIKLELFYGKVLGTILGIVHGTKIGIYVGTELGSLDVSFDNIHWLLWWPKPR